LLLNIAKGECYGGYKKKYCNGWWCVMKKIFLILGLLMLSPSLLMAGATWVPGEARSCKAACSDHKPSSLDAVESGNYSNGKPFYVCRAKENNAQGPRPGFNLAPSWDTACTITVGSGPADVTPYDCLCEAKPQPQQSATVPANQAGSELIVVKFDPASKKYWTEKFKSEATAAANLLSGFVSAGGDKVEISIKTTTEGTAYAFAEMNRPQFSGVVDTKDKFIGKTCTVNVNLASFDGKKWTSNLLSLLAHEYIHCLGFSNTVNAFNANISNGSFNGSETKKYNAGKAAPLSTDKSHFVMHFTDPAGIAPRMDDGGGQLLSILDLAVLKDIGYDVSISHNSTDAGCLNFKLNYLYAGSFKTPQYDGKTKVKVSGSCGNDTLTGKGAPGSIILLGEKGSNTYISGEHETVMVGDLNNNNHANTFRINTNKKHTIYGFSQGDKIQISSKLINADDLNALQVKGPESGDSILMETPPNSAISKPYFPLNVVIGTLTIRYFGFSGSELVNADFLKQHVVIVD